MPVEEQEKRDIYTVYMEERILLFVGTWDDDGGDACCVEGKGRNGMDGRKGTERIPLLEDCLSLGRTLLFRSREDDEAGTRRKRGSSRQGINCHSIWRTAFWLGWTALWQWTRICHLRNVAVSLSN